MAPGKTVRIAQPRVTMGTIVLNTPLPAVFQRRATRAQIMTACAPTVIGNDSTKDKDPLPGEWTLVNEANMEGRQVQMSWRQSTNLQMQYLGKELKKSLKEHPHPLFSEEMKETLKKL